MQKTDFSIVKNRKDIMKIGTSIKIIFTITIAVSAFGLFFSEFSKDAANAQSTQLLANPGFESGTTGWTNLSASGARTVDSTVFRTGTRSAKLLPSTTSVYQDVTVQAGLSYTVQGYMKTQNVGGGSLTWIRVEFFNSNGNVLSGTQVGTNPPSTSTGWIKQETTVTAPAGAVKARIKFSNSASGSTAWFDDLSMSTPSATIKVKRINPGGSLFSSATTAYIDTTSSAINPYTKTNQPVSVAHTTSVSNLSGYLVAYGTCSVSNNTNGDCTPSSYSPGNSFTVPAGTMTGGSTYVVAYRYIQDTAQLVTNSGFENGSAGWTNLPRSGTIPTSGKNLLDGTVSNTGAYSAKIIAWQPSTADPPQPIQHVSYTVQPGVRYTMQGYTKTQNTPLLDNISIQFHFFNASGNLLVSQVIRPTVQSTSWVKSELTVNAPLGAATGYIRLFNTNPYNPNSMVWFDDITLTRRSQTPLAVGDTVQVMAPNINVRQSAAASSELLGTQTQGKKGKLLEGPILQGNNWWWRVDFDTTPDGWVTEKYLEKAGGAPPITPPNFSATLQCQPPNYYVKLTWDKASNATHYMILDCRDVNKSSCVLDKTIKEIVVYPPSLDYHTLSLKNYPPYIPSSTSTVIKGYAVASYNIDSDLVSPVTLTKFVTIPAHPCTVATVDAPLESSTVVSAQRAPASIFMGVKTFFENFFPFSSALDVEKKQN